MNREELEKAMISAVRIGITSAQWDEHKKLLEEVNAHIQWQQLMNEIEASPVLQAWWENGLMLRKLARGD